MPYAHRTRRLFRTHNTDILTMFRTAIIPLFCCDQFRNPEMLERFRPQDPGMSETQF